MIKDKFQNPGLIALGVFLAAIIAYMPSLCAGGAGFFWDTPAVFGGDSFFIVSFEHGYYRPLFDLALQAERALWGEAAFGYHLLNLLLHAANSVLLFFIVRRLVPDLLTSALAAFLFALHPAHVEAVTWVFAQPWLMGAFFSLCSFLLYLNYLNNGLRNSNLLLALASALFALLAMPVNPPKILFFPLFLFASPNGVIILSFAASKTPSKNRLLYSDYGAELSAPNVGFTCKGGLARGVRKQAA